jgi:predicted ATPase
MKISVSGSAGCGKTMLVGALAARFDIPLIEENFDDVLRHASAPEEFLDSLMATLERKSALEASLSSFVSDRGPIDLMHLSLNKRLHRQHRDRVANLISNCVKQARLHDVIVFPAWQGVPLVQSEEGRLQRNLDPISQMIFHAQILGEAHIWLQGRRIVQIPPSVKELEHRVDYVERAMRNRMPDLLP